MNYITGSEYKLLTQDQQTSRRNINSNYPQTVVYELKENLSVNDPFHVEAFLVLQTITPWHDITAGSVIQRAYMSGKVKIRYSKSTDSWSEWTD